MIEQYLSNTNKSATVSILKKNRTKQGLRKFIPQVKKLVGTLIGIT
jgi:hypothetical protein